MSVVIVVVVVIVVEIAAVDAAGDVVVCIVRYNLSMLFAMFVRSIE